MPILAWLFIARIIDGILYPLWDLGLTPTMADLDCALMGSFAEVFADGRD